LERYIASGRFKRIEIVMEAISGGDSCPCVNKQRS